MQTLKIITVPNKKLEKKAQKVSVFDQKLNIFAEKLWYTMEILDGCGLASTQVCDDPSFDLKETETHRAQPSVIAISHEENHIIAVNPEILEYSKETDIQPEACLSIPGEKNSAKIQRSKQIYVQYQTLQGTTIKKRLEDMLARIFQHEYDHTIGKIFPNRLDPAREELFWLKYFERNKRE